MGLGFALCTADIFQLLLKLLIGGPRPNFFSVCQPSTILPGAAGLGYKSMYYTRNICTNPDKRAVSDALMSFPSGHSTAAFAGFTFLALWLNAKFKIVANYRARHWQLVLLSLPMVIASLLALSKRADYWHHWYDVLAGSLIGTVFAVLSYRMMYHAVWDWRWNHIPLPYAWEVHTVDQDGSMVNGEEVVTSMPTKGLTCIRWAGWRNKYSADADGEKGEVEKGDGIGGANGNSKKAQVYGMDGTNDAGIELSSFMGWHSHGKKAHADERIEAADDMGSEMKPRRRWDFMRFWV
jgi:membrane-associated phospholipid phosphatase